MLTEDFPKELDRNRPIWKYFIVFFDEFSPWKSKEEPSANPYEDQDWHFNKNTRLRKIRQRPNNKSIRRINLTWNFIPLDRRAQQFVRPGKQ